jgi:hypothetical protein
MRLIPDAARVARHAWSVRLIIIAGLLTGIEAILPLVPELLPIPLEWLVVSQFLIVMGALVARFIAQDKISGGEA